MLTRRWIVWMAVAFGVLALAPAPKAVAAETKLLPAIEAGDDGLHVQPWFLQSFLDLRDDIKEAAGKGKNLAILWEQKGCPYCRETHMVNLRVPEVVDYIRKNFEVVQLNLWGSREVVDFDGKKMAEKDLARRWGVQFTPTLQFFAADPKLALGKSGRDAEAWRLMGYWKPFHFMNSFRYVKEEGYKKEPNFQRWLQALAEEMRAKGQEVKIW